MSAETQRNIKYIPPYYDFYVRTLRDLLKKGIVKREMSVLVVCGGETDKNVFQQLGFTDVTITNLDSRWTEEEIAPYQWACQDAENLTYPDNSYDLTVVCAGLHHCHSPHRALIQIFRVARHCALAIEASDSILSRIAERLKVADEYELTAVVGDEYLYGGVKNTPIPNYVYRWTEREVTKTISSFAPYSRQRIFWYYGFAPPVLLLKGRKNLMGLMIMYVAYPVLWVATKIFKDMGNQFAFVITKPDLSKGIFPWLRLKEGVPEINPEWVEKHFKRSKKGENEKKDI
jgi:SAM-dependent methyltransferase